MTGENPACPVCGTDFERYVPTAWHCPECNRDYWKEGGSWWSCDVYGDPELVELATDGAGKLVRVDFSRYPDEIECMGCGGVAGYDGGNWGTWTCRECGMSYPWEEAHRQLEGVAP